MSRLIPMGRISADEIVHELDPGRVLDAMAEQYIKGKRPLVVWIVNDDDQEVQFPVKIDGFYRYHDLDNLIDRWDIQTITPDMIRDRELAIKGVTIMFPSEKVFSPGQDPFQRLLGRA